MVPSVLVVVVVMPRLVVLVLMRGLVLPMLLGLRM
jgi:hypothetical protein